MGESTAPDSPTEPKDINKVLDESRAKLYGETEKELSRKRGPGRPRKSVSSEDQKSELRGAEGVQPEMVSPVDEDREIKELAALTKDGCKAAADLTGYKGFEAEDPEVEGLARRTHPILKRLEGWFFPHVDGGFMMWAMGIGSVLWFGGKRYLGYQRWMAEQMAPTPTASPTPPPKPDATPLEDEPVPYVEPLAAAPGPNGIANIYATPPAL